MLAARRGQKKAGLPAVASREGWKHRLWRELHQRAVNYPRSSILAPTAELAWLRHFTAQIPCAHCRRHWLAIVRQHSPDLTTPYTYFRWTVRAHNAINARLGKRIMPFAEACSLWNFTA